MTRKEELLKELDDTEAYYIKEKKDSPIIHNALTELIDKVKRMGGHPGIKDVVYRVREIRQSYESALEDCAVICNRGRELINKLEEKHLPSKLEVREIPSSFDRVALVMEWRDDEERFKYTDRLNLSLKPSHYEYTYQIRNLTGDKDSYLSLVGTGKLKDDILPPDLWFLIGQYYGAYVRYGYAAAESDLARGLGPGAVSFSK